MKRLLPVLVILTAMLSSCKQDIPPFITTDITSLLLEREGGSFSTMLYSNGYWTATCDVEGVQISPESGYCGGMFSVTVPVNEDITTKVIRIPFEVTTPEGRKTNHKIVVTQNAQPFVYCEDPERNIGWEGGTLFFQVNSNVVWEYEAWEGEETPESVYPPFWDQNRVQLEVVIPVNTKEVAKDFHVNLVSIDYPEEAHATITIHQGTYFDE